MVTAGPAGGEPSLPDAAAPKVAKIPAPIMAPTPRAIRSRTLRTFLRCPCSSPLEATRVSIGILRKRRMIEPGLEYWKLVTYNDLRVRDAIT